MALKINLSNVGKVPCPECKESIHPKARKCPLCQSDLTQNPEWTNSRTPTGCSALLLSFAALLIGSGIIKLIAT